MLETESKPTCIKLQNSLFRTGYNSTIAFLSIAKQKAFDLFPFIFVKKNCNNFSVPFAEPPVGEQRFRPPKPKKPWNDTITANTLSPACYQVSKYWLKNNYRVRHKWAHDNLSYSKESVGT